MQYNPDVDPDPKAWLAADADERSEAVRQAVARERLPSGTNRELHAVVHETIENQVAQGDPSEVSATLATLRQGGLGRHDSIHVIGKALAAELFGMMRDGRPFDRDAYVAALTELAKGGSGR